MMKGGLGGIMKQAQQLQMNMQKAQAELANMEVEGESGSGMVKVLMTCAHEVRKVTLDDSLLTEDKEMLEDLVQLAFNDAIKKIEAITKQRMNGFTAGLGLPPGMKMPF